MNLPPISCPSLTTQSDDPSPTSPDSSVEAVRTALAVAAGWNYERRWISRLTSDRGVCDGHISSQSSFLHLRRRAFDLGVVFVPRRPVSATRWFAVALCDLDDTDRAWLASATDTASAWTLCLLDGSSAEELRILDAFEKVAHRFTRRTYGRVTAGELQRLTTAAAHDPEIARIVIGLSEDFEQTPAELVEVAHLLRAAD